MDSVSVSQQSTYNMTQAFTLISQMLPMMINFIIQLEIFKLVLDLIKSFLR